MTATIIDRGIARDAEGFLQKPEQWTEALGKDIASDLGITLTDKHWQVIRFMRQEYFEKGTGPTVRVR